jgi:hypothetical protein
MKKVYCKFCVYRPYPFERYVPECQKPSVEKYTFKESYYSPEGVIKNRIYVLCKEKNKHNNCPDYRPTIWTTIRNWLK